MTNSSIAKIQAGYEAEIRRNREAVTAQQLPLSYDAITDRWLTAVLCAKAPGAMVTAHRLGPTDNGSSNRRKIYLEYNAAGRAASLPKAVFCKAAHDLPNRIILGLCSSALGEIRFYNSIRPLLDIEAPVGYFALQDDESFNSMVILGDISDTVHSFCDHKTDMTRARAESQMRLLAAVHGRCFSNTALKERVAACPTFAAFFELTLGFGLREGSEAGFQDGVDVIPSRLFKRSAEIWPATVAAIEQLDRLPNTLAHGDVHLKNWYIAGNGQMGLSDWQCAARAHWGRDFAYAMSTALTIENRRAWEHDLLKYYLEELARNGGAVVDFNTAWNIYRRQLISALTWWTITLHPAPGLPDMQPRDVTLEFVRRISTAMNDVDSLDA